jgi:serine protease Do
MAIIARVTRAAGAAALSAVLVFGSVAPSTARGPETLAPLVEQVMDAVVNISVTQLVENRQAPSPQLPPGTPFEDFFNDFFNNRPGNRGPGPQGEGENRQRRSGSLGSGFVIDPAGIVITNNHVIGEANDITVNFNDGTRLKAEVVGRDPKVDLAVLRVKPDKPLKAVSFGDSNASRVGDWVIAIGNPFGFGGTVTAGIVSARNRALGGNYDNYIQTDASINRGNSGGPLFNMSGQVIGINTAIISPSGGSIGIGFAIPAATAVPLIKQLSEFGETRRGWLGVRIQEVDDELATSLGLDRARGALVAGIDERGPAKPAGIETGDVIVRFDGKDVRNSRELPRIVAETEVGKDVPVVIMRKGKEQTLNVKLGRLEESERQAANRPSTPNGAAPEAAPTRRTLGMDLAPLTAETRRRFSIKDTVNGVVVMRVDPNSNAATKRVQAGDVIMEVAQETVKSPGDISDRIEKLKREGKRSALLLIASAQGDLRFVAVAIE